TSLLQLARETGDALGVRNALTGLGMAALAEERYEDALPLLEEAFDSVSPLGNVWQAATSILNLATAWMLAGDLKRAEALFEEALALYRERGDEVFTARCMQHLGHVALLAGDYGRARTLFEKSLRAFYSTGEKMGIADGLEGVAAVDAATGHERRAARIAGSATALRESVGMSPFPFLDKVLRPYLARARTRLGEEAWDAAMRDGRALSVEQAMASILADA
ncbi:MAG TPA: tetratricopeptide repeat protein, partial [Chloroflexota bacterium]